MIKLKWEGKGVIFNNKYLELIRCYKSLWGG